MAFVAPAAGKCPAPPWNVCVVPVYRALSAAGEFGKKLSAGMFVARRSAPVMGFTAWRFAGLNVTVYATAFAARPSVSIITDTGKTCPTATLPVVTSEPPNVFSPSRVRRRLALAPPAASAAGIEVMGTARIDARTTAPRARTEASLRSNIAVAVRDCRAVAVRDCSPRCDDVTDCRCVLYIHYNKLKRM